MILNSKRLKEINVDLVKTAIKFADYSTKNSIAAATGLSVATCRNILDELLQTGEVKEIELADSTGGRPSRRFVYNENHAYLAVLYAGIEGENIFIYSSVVNMLGLQIQEEYDYFDDISVKEINQVLTRIVGNYPKVRVFSLGIPGVVNKGVIGICDLKKLSYKPLREYLLEKFNRIVTIENDVNCASLGYFHRTKNKNESLVYIYYPTEGIAGAGIIVNGKVLKGNNNFAGEVSYMPLGVDREKQGSIQNKSESFIKMVSNTILSVNCLMNPSKIVLTGKCFTEELIQTIRKSVSEKTPKEHIPQIDYETDIHNSYVDGLKFNGLYKLSCGFEIVQKESY